MNLIDHWGKRFAISFLTPAFLSEIISIIKGVDFSFGAFGFVFSILCYLILSVVYGFYLRNINKKDKENTLKDK